MDRSLPLNLRRFPVSAKCLGVLMLMILASAADAALIHVPGQYPTIQIGIDAALPGDTVVVACGTYYEHNIRMKQGIGLRSETGEADCVTIDVGGQPNGIWCLYFEQEATIRGLTITGASMNGLGILFSKIFVENCRFWRNTGIMGIPPNPIACSG